MADYLDAQRVLLGSMLIAPEIAGEVMSAVRPEDFPDAQCRRVFDVIRTMYLEGEPLDWPLVRARMNTPDATAVLTQIRDWTPTASNWREYVELVRQQSRIRRIQSEAINLCAQVLTLEDAARHVARLNELMVDRPGVECLSMEQGVLNFYAELEREPEYLPWGFPYLDEGLTALTAEAGDFVVIGGYPSDGKTAFALTTAYRQAETKRVGFFSLETQNAKLFHRVFSRVARVSGARIKHRTLEQQDYYNFQAKADEVKSRMLHLVKASGMTAADIRAYTLARRFDVIYVDYLTLVEDGGRDDYHKATNISMAMHRLAQDTGVTVVALSQLSRPEGKNAGKAPTLSSLRSSGQIEQDADIVMLLYREKPGRLRSRRILRVAKNKEGLTGFFPLLFRGEYQDFVQDTAPVREPEPEEKQTAFFDLPGSEFTPLSDADGPLPF